MADRETRQRKLEVMAAAIKAKFDNAAFSKATGPMMKQVEDWAAAQGLSRWDAVSQLVELALKAGKERK